MSAMETFTPTTRPLPAPYALQRTHTTPAPRPSTSSGEAVVPSSDILRRALHDRRQIPPRAQSTTPRKPKAGFRSSAYVDPWMPSDEDEPRPKLTRSTTGRIHRRRATDATSTRRPALTPSPPPTPCPGIGLRDEQMVVDRLKKENWDLKHRITLQQQHATKLQADLEAALAELERSRDIRDRHVVLERENHRLKQKLEISEDHNSTLQEELATLDEEVNTVMAEKDAEIHDRQLAIEEAAGIIQRLEQENGELKQMAPSPSLIALDPADSDYFSADQEGAPLDNPSRKKAKESITEQPITTIVSAPLGCPVSDLSPLTTPAPGRVSIPDTCETPEIPSASALKTSSQPQTTTYDHEVGLKSAVSKDSLLMSYLEYGITPPRKPARPLRYTISSNASSTVKPASSGLSAPTEASLAMKKSRPLRELFQSGELGRSLHSSGGSTNRSFSPSTLASISGFSRSAVSDDRSDIFSRAGSTNTRASTPSASIHRDSHVKDNRGRDHTLSESTPRANTPTRLINPAAASTPVFETRTPVNYDSWPRQYPEWPPSASLHNRDALYRANIATSHEVETLFDSHFSEGSDGGVAITRRATSKGVRNGPRRSESHLMTNPSTSYHENRQDIHPQPKMRRESVGGVISDDSGASMGFRASANDRLVGERDKHHIRSLTSSSLVAAGQFVARGLSFKAGAAGSWARSNSASRV